MATGHTSGAVKRLSFSDPTPSIESGFSLVSGKQDPKGLKNVYEESFYILGRASSFQSEHESLPLESELDEGPYGRCYEEITLKHLKEISYELGLISLSWPENVSPDYEKYVSFIHLICLNQC